MKILAVDDNEVALEVLTRELTLAGHQVQSARDGQEALEVLGDDPQQLVISDWEMPRMNGLDLCRHVRAGDYPNYIYVILLTSHQGTDRVVTGLTAGADDFLSKPFHPAELRIRVRAAERVLSLETRDVAIFAMARLAESRDPDTGAHLERVRAYSRLIARNLGRQEPYRQEIDPEFVRLIYLTSPLHDIGKVGIPDSVLLKPDRLTDREYEIMKTHTTIGAETLDAAARQFPGIRFLRMAREIALTHHERYDGTGYPDGLSGDDIPLSGRIVALADVYDALTTRRVYKEAYSHDVARAIILPERGRQFDPAVIDAFLECEREIVAVGDQFQVAELKSL